LTTKASIQCAVDLHKRVSQVLKEDQRTGERIERRVDNQDHQAWQELFAAEGPETEVVVEATGNWMWFADMLEEMGCTVHLAHPGKSRIIAESRNKSDKLDAKALLMLMQGGWLPEAYLSPRPVREQRQILRLRIGLVQMRTRLKNRLHALLAQHNLQTEESDLFGKSGRKYLEEVELPPASARSRQVWLELLDELERQIDKLERAFHATLVKDPRAQLLMSMPGVGELTAYLLLAEIGEIERFRRPEDLAAYAGLAPSNRASADKIHHGRVGGGRPSLRWALVE
jgi:transposase